MRITFNMRGMMMKDMISTSLTNYMEANKKVNAQKDLIHPWSNTSNYVGAYNIQNMIDELTQFSENANSASNWLNNTDAELQELIEALKKARDDYAIAGASDSYDEESRKALAQDVLSLYNQIMDIANANYMGRYIFGGYETSKPPFSTGSNSVSNVITKNENGESMSGDAIIKDIFTDMTELKTGQYRAEITVTDGIAKLRLYDEKGNVMIVDSNGSDESGGNGNRSTTTLTFEYEPGKVINTGRGISIKLPDDLENATSLSMTFDYKSGSQVTYQGDNGYIYSQIGYSQDIAVNTPGGNIFTQISKLLQGTAFNTVNGLPATSNTYFQDLDNTNIGIGDSIKVSGTDHNGNKVGIASLISVTNANLDLSTASEKERTLNITYGDKIYKVVVPQKAYTSTEELANAVNAELKNAEYVGSLGNLSGSHATIDDYAAAVKSQINTGNFEGEATLEDKNKFKMDLSGQIKISADGGRLQFQTTKAGDNVRLAVSGSEQNLLGFKNQTVAAEGKDTTFEIGYEFHTDTIEPVQTTHENMDLTGTSYTVFVNGKEVTINKPATTVTNTNMANVAFGTEDVTLSINGRNVLIKAADFNNAADKQAFIRDEIAKAGLQGEAAIDGWTDNGDGTYTFNLHTTTPTKKELEYSFNKALQDAGFDFGVGVRLESTSSDVGQLGVFNVTFELSNYNMDRDTTLTTTFYDRTVIPPASDMKTAKLDRENMNAAEGRTLGDYVDFIKNLYGEAVDVSIQDGKLTIADLRSGDSKLSFNTNAQNQGISHANDQVTIVGGAYTGKSDNTWNVSVTTTLGTNDQRNVSILIVDKNGTKIYEGTVSDYKGGPIELPQGVTITPDDMEIPNPLEPDKREATTTFQIDLKAEPSLTFGDINPVETGKNVNIFKTLENLMNALEHNITKNGFGEPSAWRDTELKSTAKPFLDGAFQGNFNDSWRYEILSGSNKTDFYLQNEYKDTTGQIRYDAELGTDVPLQFSVDIFDNKTGEQKRVDVNIDLSKANPPVTDDASLQQYILKELNNNKDLTNAGVRFTSKDGKIEIQSGSGTKIANFVNSAIEQPARSVANYIMGFDTISNGTLLDEITVPAGGTFTFRVADPLAPAGANKFQDITVNIPAPVPATMTKEEMLELVNNQLELPEPQGTNGRVKANIDKNGSIAFSTASTDVPLEVSVLAGSDNPLNIGLTHNGAGQVAEMLVTGVQSPKTDLSEADDKARTLTFKYTTGNPETQKEVSIMLDKKEYGSVQEMADDINAKLAAKGLNTNIMQAVVTSSGELAFTRADNTINSFVVEGDYAGTLGFPKAGDSVKVKVTNNDGYLVQNVDLDTANKSVFVSDGLYLGFDAGSLNATDSFTASVGSGVEGELDNLETAINQVLSVATLVGTRGQRVESVLKFQESVITSSENVKAEYLGATPVDITKLTSDLELANIAYQQALSLSTKMMSISILDFLA